MSVVVDYVIGAVAVALVVIAFVALAAAHRD